MEKAPKCQPWAWQWFSDAQTCELELVPASPGCTRHTQIVQSLPSLWMELPVQSSSCNLRVRGNACSVLDTLPGPEDGVPSSQCLLMGTGSDLELLSVPCPGTALACCHSHPHTPLESPILPPTDLPRAACKPSLPK